MTFDPPENVGGIEGRSKAYAAELTRRGHAVHLLVFSPVRSPPPAEPFDYASTRFNSSVFRLPRAMVATLEVLRKGSFQSLLLISGSLTFFGLCLLISCRALRIHSIAFFYGRDILSARKHLAKSFLLNCAISLADKVAVNSNFTRSLLPGGVSKSVLIQPSVHQGMVNEVNVSTNTSRTNRILFVGRLVWRKGADVLLNAFAELTILCPDSVLDVVGDGPEMPALRNLAHRLGVGGKVVFHGSLVGPELYARFSESDVVAMPSKGTSNDVEGFGTVFIEAGIFGKPVVGTWTGGIPEAVLDGKTGLLVPDGDTHALAEALHRILSDQGLRVRLGTEGRKRALSEFTLTKVVDKIEQAIRA